MALRSYLIVAFRCGSDNSAMRCASGQMKQLRRMRQSSTSTNPSTRTVGRRAVRNHQNQHQSHENLFKLITIGCANKILATDGNPAFSLSVFAQVDDDGT